MVRFNPDLPDCEQRHVALLVLHGLLDGVLCEPRTFELPDAIGPGHHLEEVAYFLVPHSLKLIRDVACSRHCGTQLVLFAHYPFVLADLQSVARLRDQPQPQLRSLLRALSHVPPSVSLLIDEHIEAPTRAWMSAVCNESLGAGHLVQPADLRPSHGAEVA